MANETLAETLERPREHRENRKKNRGRKVADNQALAVVKGIRVPPRKARLVIDEVRGKYVMDALAFLRFIPNRAAGYISKVLASAVANAANNHDLNPENLRLVTAKVDEGPRMKRVQPRAQGRAYRILKRTSHITIIVEEVGPKPRKPRKVAPGRRAQAAREARQPQARVAAAPEPVVETPVTSVATAETPVVTTPEATTAPTPVTEDTVETPAVNTASQGEQTANSNVSTTTDEIGAPVTPEMPATPAPTVEASASATTAEEGGANVTQGEQVADTQDKTDEIGAPTNTDA